MIAPFTEQHMRHIDQMTFEAKKEYCNHIVREFVRATCKHRHYRVEEIAMTTHPPDLDMDQMKFVLVCDTCEVPVEPTGLRPRA